MDHTVEGLEIDERAEGFPFVTFPNPEQITQGKDVIHTGSVWTETVLLVHQLLCTFQKATDPASQ